MKRRRAIGQPPDLLLPEGTRLVHIGPHKTGTTSLQGAFHAARRAMARQGVHYASPNRQAMQAARAVVGRASPYADGRVPDRSHWLSLVHQVARSTAGRVLLSAETLADADAAAIRRVVGDLDSSRVHVVATLRPLAQILPSQWQQFVQNGLSRGWEDWLSTIFGDSNGAPPGSLARFWHRHRHDQLVARWAAVVGPSRVTAIVVDDRDREATLRVFERLLGLRDGTLQPADGGRNRSLTRAEVELVRAMHARMTELGISHGLRLNLVFHGAAANLKLRDPERAERRLVLPPWVGERLETVSREIVDGIDAAGIRVIGDLESLVGVPVPRHRHRTNTPDPWPTIGARALMGVLVQTGLTRTGATPIPELAEWSTHRLTSLLAARVRWTLGPNSLALRTARTLTRPGRRARRTAGS